ncbi:indole-3-acetic acid-amido synthetase GH3.10 [Tanacetum coccineum]|uniref:Indole-3-acetic acid-amido synthetase GH3.10 n=1 Tax=Tanacetum coccineum TaxID=301880 RepID=A0ABQ5BMB7_9ASTR
MELTHVSSLTDDAMNWFEEVAMNAKKVQTETLKKILEMNYGVEYLQKWLGNIDDVGSMDGEELESLYGSKVPLASHADLEPYIQRIADGDTSPLLTKQLITTLSLSSGTTEGRQKFIPFTSHSSMTTLQIFKLAAAYRSRVYPTREGGKILEFIYGNKLFKTKGGLSAGTATTHYFASQEFKLKQQQTKSYTCSPQEGNHLPLVSAEYGSTESWIGVNMDPSFNAQDVTFVVVPTFSYFEFIPLHLQHHKACDHMVSNVVAGDVDYLEDDPVPLSKVEIGKQSLQITEKDLQLAVEKGSQPLVKAGVELVDFTSHANIKNQPGHYVVYWEIKGEASEEILVHCCKEIDAAFVDHGYIVSRKNNSIGPLELCIVEQGTFKKEHGKQHIIDSKWCNDEPFKTPMMQRLFIFLLENLDQLELSGVYSGSALRLF